MILAIQTITLKATVLFVVLLLVCGYVLTLVQPHIHPRLFNFICVVIVGAFALFVLQFFELL